jgi:hypothetical protein
VAIRRVETIEGKIPVTAVNEAALRATLVSAGVDFIDENGGGPGVRLRKVPNQKREETYSNAHQKTSPIRQ